MAVMESLDFISDSVFDWIQFDLKMHVNYNIILSKVTSKLCIQHDLFIISNTQITKFAAIGIVILNQGIYLPGKPGGDFCWSGFRENLNREFILKLGHFFKVCASF